ncbi:MAG: ABC transporter substrate-binding protein [Dehalococcoidia bacterium]
MQRFEDLAKELGANIETAEQTAAKAEFVEAETALKKAIASKPGITVMGVSANDEAVWIINPNLAHDMLWFQNLGMDILMPPIVESEWWEQLSWERVAAHDNEVDLILVDQRTQSLTADEMAERARWPRLKAVAAGQVGPWYSETTYSWKGFTPVIRDTIDALLAAEDIV